MREIKATTHSRNVHYRLISQRTSVKMPDGRDKRAPDLDKVNWPKPREAEEDPDPLFDSDRDYVAQVDRYKEHQDKPIARKAACRRE